MIDIDFYQMVGSLKTRLMAGEKLPRYNVEFYLELGLDEPVVYNIETTNACNMACEMCPRSKLMTRPIKTMDLPTFTRIIDQCRPFTDEQWQKWVEFAERYYGVPRDGMSENHFFLYVIPKVIVLHGYGDPLLDPMMPERIRLMTERGLPSYFSCNPANINLERTQQTFANGLDYIKYSIESVDDLRHKAVRGEASNFTQSYRDIMTLFELKAQRGYKTQIVITMINLGKPWQADEFGRLQEAFKGTDAYVYLKSQDQCWYEDNRVETQSIHWREFCQFPWSSMTIKSDGIATSCVEDFNNEIVLGDTKKQSLAEIWNGAKYAKFRRDHFDMTAGIKCTKQCDMKLIGECVEAK